MSTIYLDPLAMDAVAGAISEHAREVDAAIGDLESVCAAEVPPSLAGWLGEELRDIAVHARLAEVLYVVAALDTALRAGQIRADQSLAVAWPGPEISVVGGTGPGIAAGPALSTVAVGGTGPGIAGTTGLSTVAVGGSSPLPSGVTGGQSVWTDGPLDVGPYTGLRDPGNHASAAALLELASLPASLNNTTLAPNGIVYSRGEYEDSSGRRGAGDAIYRNPDRPGEFRVRP
jgi:hypothetical protein